MILLSPNERGEKISKGEGLFDKIKKGGKEFVEGVKEEINTGTSTIEEKAQGFKSQQSTKVRSAIAERKTQTTTPEELYFSTWAWFWALIFATIGCLFLFFMGLTNSRFFYLGLLSLLAFPFITGWCLVHMIPTVKIFGYTIFDRRKLSLRRQLSVGKEIARLFSREFIGDEPLFAFFVFLFIFAFVLALAIAFISV
ncbi:MAG: hypothetical protein ACFFE8_11030 [Candidatus Heimdallarchaeota archaeon]